MAKDEPSEEELLQNLLDEYEKEMDEEQNQLGYTAKERDNQYRFFRDILKQKDNTKIANLTKMELGMLRMSVRSCLNISNLSNTLGLNEFTEYYKQKAEIILGSSMSRKGFWAQLFVTQIKKEQKILPQQPQKKGLFNWGGSTESDSSG